MTERVDDITGHILQYPTDLPQIAGEARRFADSTIGWATAEAIHRFTNAEDGGAWFTRWKLGNTASVNQGINIGEHLGLWAKADGKDWWRHCRQTWPWVMTALALRDEWGKRSEATLTQADYDAHNWYRSEHNEPKELTK